MPSIRQTSFRSGELAPSMWGRTDASQFAHGLRRAKDFYVDRQGSAVSRPGTVHLQLLSGGVGAVRLVPFIYADSAACIIVFLDNGIATAYDRNGVQVGSAFGHPFTASALRDIQWAQQGAMMVLTHQDFAPQKLEWDGADWSMGAFPFVRESICWVEVGNATQATDAPSLLSDNALTLFNLNADYPAREWRWFVTATLRDTTTGVEVETSGYQVVTYKKETAEAGVYGARATLPTYRVVCYPDAPVTIKRPALSLDSGATFPSTWLPVRYNYYRGRGGLYGYVGSTETDTFDDFGEEPDYTLQPPSYPQVLTGPFEGPAGASYPSSITFHEGRLVFAGGKHRPSTVWLSRVNDYQEFILPPLPYSSGPLEYELGTRKRERVRALMGGRQLVLATDTSAWTLSGGDVPMDAGVVPMAIQHDEVGCTGLAPLLVQGRYLYVRARGRGVRTLTPDGNMLRGADATWHAAHLFQGWDELDADGGLLASYANRRAIVDWAYAEDPAGVVWAARADGVLLSATPAGDSIAWCRHETDGFVSAVASIPGEDEDEVFLAVWRDDGEFGLRLRVERMASRTLNDGPNDGCCVDGAYVTDFNMASWSDTTPVWLGPYPRHLGKEVWVCGAGNEPQGPYVVNGDGLINITQKPKPNYTNIGSGLTYARLYIGRLYQPELETLDLVSPDTRTVEKTVISVGLEVSLSRGLQVGQDFDHLVEWQQRSVADSYGSIANATELVKVPIEGTWDRHARAAVRQTLPLPVTITGLVREVDVGRR